MNIARDIKPTRLVLVLFFFQVSDQPVTLFTTVRETVYILISAYFSFLVKWVTSCIGKSLLLEGVPLAEFFQGLAHVVSSLSLFFYRCHVSQGSPEKQKEWDVYVYTERDIYFKELAHTIMEAGKSRSAGLASRLETLGRASAAVQVRRPCAGRIPSCSGEVGLCAIKAFTWLDEAHPRNGGHSALLKVHGFKC